MAAYFWPKLSITLGLFIVTLIFSSLPWLLHSKVRKSRRILSLLTCLAGGVIMGSLLFHLIPEFLPHDHSHRAYKWGSLAAGLAFLLLLGIDRFFLSHYHCSKEEHSNHSLNYPKHAFKNDSFGHTDSHFIPALAECTVDIDSHRTTSSTKQEPLTECEVGTPRPSPNVFNLQEEMPSIEENIQNKTLKLEDVDMDDHSSCHSGDVVGGCHMDGINEHSTQIQSLLFVAALSVHSFLEGLAVNSISTSQDLFSFSLSLFMHKFLEAFALGMNVYKANFLMHHYISIIGLYSILTPLGIILGMLSHPYATVTQILSGLAAGSFLYVACIEMIVPEFHKPDKLTPYKFGALLFGFVAMAFLDAWAVPHHH